MQRFLFLLITLSSFSFHAHARVVEKIVAVVNDQIITLSDIDVYKEKIRTAGLIDETLLSLADTQTLLKDRAALVNHLIDERVLDSEVKRASLGVTIERVEQEIRNILQRNGMNRNQLKQALAGKGVAFSDYQDFVRSTIERQNLIEREVSSKIKISEDDISTYFMHKKGGGDGQTYEYSLSHILFLPKNGGEAAALERAKQVKAKLSTGSFEKLAEQFSEDPSFSQGGLLGVFRGSELNSDLESAVRNLKIGDVSDVVKSKMGYHILRVNRKTLTADPRLNKEREEIRGLLYAEAFRKQLRLWLNAKREESFVRIN